MYILTSDLSDMSEVPLPSDDSDVYHSGSSGDESIASITSDQRSSSASRESRFSTSAETLSNEEAGDVGSTDSSVYIEPRTDMEDSEDAFNLDIAGESDSDVGPISDEGEEEEEDVSIPSPGDFSSLLRESHFRLICDGSNTVFIEAMVLIFQFALK